VTSVETIPNKALSGAEVKRLIMGDCERLIANESLLADHLAYGRISYEVRLTMHIDNQFIPVSVSTIASRPVGLNTLPAMPEMVALEGAPPLNGPSGEAIITAQQVERVIDSPNSERLRMGLPVPADVRQPDGSILTEQIKYPATGEDGTVTVKDVSTEARDELKFKGAK